MNRSRRGSDDVDRKVATLLNALGKLPPHGRAIQDLSRHPEEQEVVFLPSSMFTVVRSARVDDLPVTIVEQLNPELGELDEPLGTLEEIAAFTVSRVGTARQSPPVEVTTPGKFVGDIS